LVSELNNGSRLGRTEVCTLSGSHFVFVQRLSLRRPVDRRPDQLQRLRQRLRRSAGCGGRPAAAAVALLQRNLPWENINENTILVLDDRQSRCDYPDPERKGSILEPDEMKNEFLFFFFCGNIYLYIFFLIYILLYIKYIIGLLLKIWEQYWVEIPKYTVISKKI